MAIENSISSTNHEVPIYGGKFSTKYILGKFLNKYIVYLYNLTGVGDIIGMGSTATCRLCTSKKSGRVFATKILNKPEVFVSLLNHHNIKNKFKFYFYDLILRYNENFLTFWINFTQKSMFLMRFFDCNFQKCFYTLYFLYFIGFINY